MRKDTGEVDVTEAVLHDQQARLRFGNHITDFVAFIAGVQGHKGRPNTCQGEVESQPVTAVHQPHRDGISIGDTLTAEPLLLLLAELIKLPEGGFMIIFHKDNCFGVSVNVHLHQAIQMLAAAHVSFLFIFSSARPSVYATRLMIGGQSRRHIPPDQYSCTKDHSQVTQYQYQVAHNFTQFEPRDSEGW